MLKIAITGSPGSGKTTVAKIFKNLGAEVINADAICHSLFVPCQGAYHEILNYFGQGCLTPNGSLNKNFLRKKLIFSSKDRKTLENILHPRVYAKMVEHFREVKGETEIIIVEIPLLFEVGWEEEFDKVIVVHADKKRCINRLQKRGFSKEEIEKIFALQWPIEEKIKRADFIINNNYDLNTTNREIKKIWEKLRG
jgi:dephospho-CoA kinase